MDHEKLKTAYHETCHAVMALLCDLKIRRVSIVGTDTYRGVMSTEPPERQITNPQEAMREIRISLSGFVGEMMISDQFTIARYHPDLIGAAEMAEQLLEYDHELRNYAEALATKKPGTINFIESPLIRAFIDDKIRWCYRKLDTYKPVIKLIAEDLYIKEELTGDEVSTFFNSFMPSSQHTN
jgi:ATP-dependent Zn protease